MPSTRFCTGQWLRHTVRPDWGPGEVLAVSDSLLLVRFTRAGLKRLVPQGIEQALEPVDGLQNATG